MNIDQIYIYNGYKNKLTLSLYLFTTVKYIDRVYSKSAATISSSLSL